MLFPHLDLSAEFIGQSYAKQMQEAQNSRNQLVKNLLTHRRLPKEGWDVSSISLFLQELSLLDSNNFLENVGVGEREGRIYSPLVRQRNLNFSHGIGRSGDIIANQPKAAGSSLISRLCHNLALDAIHVCNLTSMSDCVILPMATGMSLTFCLLQLKQCRPRAQYVIWSRIDQKSAFKSILTAGLIPLIVELKRDNTVLKTDVDEIEKLIKNYKRDSILCVMTTTSTFAPRIPDDVQTVAQICNSSDVPHVINNAYGLQCFFCCHIIEQAARKGRVDYVVQSLDKNFLVPVGGSLVSSPSKANIQQLAKMYPGRASAGAVIDLFITLLQMGSTGLQKLREKRKKLSMWFKNELSNNLKPFDCSLLPTPQNKISFAINISHLSQPSTLTSLGSQLFYNRCSGSRVVICLPKKSSKFSDQLFSEKNTSQSFSDSHPNAIINKQSNSSTVSNSSSRDKVGLKKESHNPIHFHNTMPYLSQKKIDNLVSNKHSQSYIREIFSNSIGSKYLQNSSKYVDEFLNDPSREVIDSFHEVDDNSDSSVTKVTYKCLPENSTDTQYLIKGEDSNKILQKGESMGDFTGTMFKISNSFEGTVHQNFKPTSLIIEGLGYKDTTNYLETNKNFFKGPSTSKLDLWTFKQPESSKYRETPSTSYSLSEIILFFKSLGGPNAQVFSSKLKSFAAKLEGKKKFIAENIIPASIISTLPFHPYNTSETSRFSDSRDLPSQQFIIDSNTKSSQKLIDIDIGMDSKLPSFTLDINNCDKELEEVTKVYLNKINELNKRLENISKTAFKVITGELDQNLLTSTDNSNELHTNDFTLDLSDNLITDQCNFSKNITYIPQTVPSSSLKLPANKDNNNLSFSIPTDSQLNIQGSLSNEPILNNNLQRVPIILNETPLTFSKFSNPLKLTTDQVISPIESSLSKNFNHFESSISPECNENALKCATEDFINLSPQATKSLSTTAIKSTNPSVPTLIDPPHPLHLIQCNDIKLTSCCTPTDSNILAPHDNSINIPNRDNHVIKTTQTIGKYSFKNYGSHCDDYPHSYLTVACAIGTDQAELELFIKRLKKILKRHHHIKQTNHYH